MGQLLPFWTEEEIETLRKIPKLRVFSEPYTSLQIQLLVLFPLVIKAVVSFLKVFFFKVWF